MGHPSPDDSRLMKRGDVVIVRESNSPASKARPCIVIQRNSALAAADKVTICPLTSVLKGSAGQRPFVAPTPENRLRVPSEAEIDGVYTHPVERIGAVVGTIDHPTMLQIDRALRRWLDL